MKETKKFGIILSLILVAVGVFHLVKGHKEVYFWYIWIAAFIFVSSLFIPVAIRPLFIGFTRVSRIVGWVNTRFLLTVIFYLLISPVGIILRVLRRDFLKRKFDRDVKTYWIKREPVVRGTERYESQF